MLYGLLRRLDLLPNPLKIEKPRGSLKKPG
jgi:hypothetical protein